MVTDPIVLEQNTHEPRLCVHHTAIPDYEAWYKTTFDACHPATFAGTHVYKRRITVNRMVYHGCFPINPPDANGYVIICYDFTSVSMHWRSPSDKLPPLKAWVLLSVITQRPIKGAYGVCAEIREVVAGMRVFGTTAEDVIWTFADELHGPVTGGQRVVQAWGQLPLYHDS